MGKTSKFFKPALSPSQQMLVMANTYAGQFRASYDRNHSVNWIGAILPCGLGNKYDVRIVYRHGRRPLVWVTNPAIRHLEDGKKVPHTFADDSICLHLHGEWQPWMPIALTVVPWTSLWLYHYEVWQATDKWHGGGHEPAGPDQDNKRQEPRV
jgi:hypothetical protein